MKELSLLDKSNSGVERVVIRRSGVMLDLIILTLIKRRKEKKRKAYNIMSTASLTHSY